MATGRTLVNAVIGAVVGIVLSFVPLSTLIGGVVAGFLEGPDTRQGAIVGALAGAFTFLPVAGFAVFGLGIIGFGLGIAEAPIEGFAIAALALVGFGFVMFLYTVGLSLLGGYLGAYLAREYPTQRTRTRETIGLTSADRSQSLESIRPPGARSDSMRDRDRGRGRPRARETDSERERDQDAERDRP